MHKTNTDHILILGMGITGLSLLNYLSKKNKTISVYDQNKSLDKLKEITKNYEVQNLYIGDVNKLIFNNISSVAVSPGVKLESEVKEKLKKNHVEIINDLYLLAQEIEGSNIKLIGVTGTNGKTTTCSIIKFLLLQQGIKAEVVGNIGKPVLDILPIKNLDVLIIELSSFQLEIESFLKFDVGITLNISEDHLDRHNSFVDYIQAKKNLHKNSYKKIINYDDPNLHDWYDENTSSVSLFSNKECPDYYLTYSSSKPFLKDKKGFELDLSESRLQGKHNLFNVMASIAAIRAIFLNFECKKIQLKNFCGIPHRLEWVRSLRGIDFYNDSKATNIASTIAAVNSFSNKNIHLIIGGDSKKQSLAPLKKILLQNIQSIALIGKDATIFQAEFSSNESLSIKNCKVMDEAVKFLFSLAKENDIVLLSPACSSLDSYTDYKARGDDFKKNVNLLE